MSTFVNSIDELPRENNYVYHRTDKKNVSSILSNGINNKKQIRKWCELNEFLTYVAKENNIKNKPINRSNCVFAYPRFADVGNINMKNNAILAVDLNFIEGNIYRASYHKVTEINEKLNSKSEAMENQLLLDMALEYWNNMEKCTKKINKGGEVLINSSVSSNAIKYVVK